MTLLFTGERITDFTLKKEGDEAGCGSTIDLKQKG